jgi:uncharacterized membrane protein
MHSLFRRDFRLVSNTSIWMFFIYGLAVFMEPLVHAVSGFPIIMRGVIYVCCIFILEYTAGMLMTKLKVCPWDYSSAKLNIHGVIRLDYAPAWFALGLLFEYVCVNI